MSEVKNIILPSLMFLSLVTVDYLLGNGLLYVLQRTVWWIFYIVKGIWITNNERPINVFVTISKVSFLLITIAMLNRYSSLKTVDRIDHLLKESRQGLRITNAFLEKWRLRRIPTNMDTYLDEEPQSIPPMKLEIPILHMAIVDTRGSTRNQHEGGDASGPMNTSDATVLSVSSIMDDDIEAVLNTPSVDLMAEKRSFDNRNRYLWNVLEEDVNDIQEQ